MMKKTALLLLSLLLSFTLAGCGTAKKPESTSTSQGLPEKELESKDLNQEMDEGSDAAGSADEQSSSQKKEKH